MFFQMSIIRQTDGRYELRENLLNEFKIGTFNSNYKSFFPPIFPNLKGSRIKIM